MLVADTKPAILTSPGYPKKYPRLEHDYKLNFRAEIMDFLFLDP